MTGVAGLHVFALLRHSENSWLFLLTGAEAEAWPFLLGHASTAAIPMLPNWTAGTSLKCLRVDGAATADL